MPFIGNQPALAYTSFAKQDFTTSATTSYTLDNPVTNENEIALFINFVRQEPTTAYTASGTSLTLTSATSASDDMYCVFLGKAVQTVNPPAGSVGISQLSATGTKDSTTFLRGDNTFASAGGANTPAFLAYRTAQQNLSNGVTTKCEYNVELFDTDNCYDNSTNYRFTPTTAGKYYIFHNSIYGRDTSNVWDYGNIYIYKNGSFIAIQGASTTSAQNVWYQTVSTIADMNGSSDYIEAYIDNYVSSGTPRIGGGLQYSQFGAYKIIE